MMIFIYFNGVPEVFDFTSKHSACSHNIEINSKLFCRFCTAISNGVSLSKFIASTLAPYWIRFLTTSLSQFDIAMCSGVSPLIP